MKLVVLSSEQEMFAVPIVSVQLLNKELDTVPKKIKFQGKVIRVIAPPFVPSADMEQVKNTAEHREAELTKQIAVLQNKLTLLKEELEKITTLLD